MDHSQDQETESLLQSRKRKANEIEELVLDIEDLENTNTSNIYHVVEDVSPSDSKLERKKAKKFVPPVKMNLSESI